MHLGEFSVAANEARRLCREVVQQLRVVERPEGWKGRRQTVGLELEDLFGPAEVLQPVEAKIPEGGAHRHRVADQGGRRGRDHDLTPVGDRRNPSSTVNVETDKADCSL